MRATVIFLILFVIFNSNAQKNREINGTIYSSDSTSALKGVTIRLEEVNLSTLTNSNGEFKFSNLNAGEYNVIIIHPGYRKIRVSVILELNKNLTTTFYLSEEVLDLPEAVIKHISLTGGEQGIKELPGSAYYLSPKELEKFNFSDINRVLRSVPGVNIQEEDGFGLRPNIGLRGTGVERSSKITLMEDGILIAPAPYSSPAAYYFPTIGRMQAIEILKGSSQIKYGPFTTGGAINFISNQIPSDLHVKLSLTGGSFGGRNVHAFIGNSTTHFGYSVEALNFSSDGFKVLDNGGNTGFDKSDFIVKFRINTKLTARYFQSLTFKAGNTNENSADTYLGISKEDFDKTPYRRYAASQKDQMLSTQTQISATHVIKARRFLNITTVVYRNNFHRNWYKLDAVKDSSGAKIGIASLLNGTTNYTEAYAILKGQSSENSDALFVKGNNRTYYSQGVQTVVGLDFKTGKIYHDIDLGFRIHEDNMDRFQYEDQYRMSNGSMLLTAAGTLGLESNRISNALAAASYIQYKLIYKRLTATSGLRHEHIVLSEKDFGNTDPTRTGLNLKTTQNKVDVFIPGIALDYKINLKLAAFAGVHKGFAPPGTVDGTQPEESINYEGGFKYYTKGISSQVVVYFNDYKNLLGADLAAGGGTGSGAQFNGGKAESKGVEFQFIYDVLSKSKKNFAMPLTIGYTFTDARFKSDFKSTFGDWGTVENGDMLPYLSAHQISANLTLENSKFSVNLGTKYNSEMRTVAGFGAIPSDELIPAFFVMDAGVKFQIHKNISIVANAINLTNKVYLVSTRPAGLRPGMPRAFQIGLKANL
jgi:Fe(3+) dicitrate transport protein